MLEATQVLEASVFVEEEGEEEAAIIGRLVVEGKSHLVSIQM